MVQLISDTYLRDENYEILTYIPAGYVVEIVNYDQNTDRCWIRWNCRFGWIDSRTIWSDTNCYCDNDDNTEVYYDYNDDSIEECYYEDNYGYAIVKPLIGVNVRDSKNNVIIAVPYGNKVTLIEPLNIGGRTLIYWNGYIRTVLTSCLEDYSV